jgi:hypothetical protein
LNDFLFIYYFSKKKMGILFNFLKTSSRGVQYPRSEHGSFKTYDQTSGDENTCKGGEG